MEGEAREIVPLSRAAFFASLLVQSRNIADRGGYVCPKYVDVADRLRRRSTSATSSLPTGSRLLPSAGRTPRKRRRATLCRTHRTCEGRTPSGPNKSRECLLAGGRSRQGVGVARGISRRCDKKRGGRKDRQKKHAELRHWASLFNDLDPRLGVEASPRQRSPWLQLSTSLGAHQSSGATPPT
jgi:hypothetical protein